jgi:ribose/xylose/arabinose/galactoside ABC-type transport system permease subunit
MRGVPTILTRTLAVIGAALGAVVAVVAHFMSDKLPHYYYVGTFTSDGSSQAEVLPGVPYVHPGWLPTLPLAMVVGLVIGAAAGVILDRAGIGYVRTRPQPGPSDQSPAE